MSSPNGGGRCGPVGDDVADLQRRHAVDQRLMRLGVEGDAVLGQALDQVHLPQRPRLVQRPRGQPGDQLVQLLVAARRRQRRAPDVIGDVEVAVVDPHRPGQPHRDFADLLPVPRYLRQPPLDGGQQGLVAQPGARAGAGSTASRRTSGSRCSPAGRTTRPMRTTGSPSRRRPPHVPADWSPTSAAHGNRSARGRARRVHTRSRELCDHRHTVCPSPAGPRLGRSIVRAMHRPTRATDSHRAGLRAVTPVVDYEPPAALSGTARAALADDRCGGRQYRMPPHTASDTGRHRPCRSDAARPTLRRRRAAAAYSR